MKPNSGELNSLIILVRILPLFLPSYEEKIHSLLCFVTAIVCFFKSLKHNLKRCNWNKCDPIDKVCTHLSMMRYSFCIDSLMNSSLKSSIGEIQYACCIHKNISVQKMYCNLISVIVSVISVSLKLSV